MWKDVPPAWTKADGPEADIVVSTRARLARNLSGAPFPGRASAENIENTAKLAEMAYNRLRQIWPALEIVDVGQIDEEDRSFLIDAHLASPEQVRPRSGGIVLLEPGGRIAIMINEEDHFRIQAILSGLQPLPAWRLVDDLDDGLSREVKFAYSKRLGYLTASLSNLGTGLRISAMMHLAGLSVVGRLAGTLHAAIDLGVSVRGLFGEGSKGLGDLYQVSNEVTLGIPEKELVERIGAVSSHILGQERAAREEIMAGQRMELIMAARHNLTKFRNAETISAGDALRLLSPIRLAGALGLTEGCSARNLNELMVAMRVMRIDDPGPYSSATADRRRAVLIRRRLRGMEV